MEDEVCTALEKILSNLKVKTLLKELKVSGFLFTIHEDYQRFL